MMLLLEHLIAYPNHCLSFRCIGTIVEKNHKYLVLIILASTVNSYGKIRSLYNNKGIDRNDNIEIDNSSSEHCKYNIKSVELPIIIVI